MALDLLWWNLVDVAVVVAVAVVLPACLGGPRWWWFAATVGATLGAAMPVGPIAATFAAGWLVVGVAVAATHVRAWQAHRSWCAGCRLVASGYAIGAAAWFVASCAGWQPFGIAEPIVELTAVHFSYVGVGAVMLAAWAHEAVRPPSAAAPGWRSAAAFAVIATVGAPPVVAVGFLLGSAVAQVGGAVAMAMAVYATAALELREARADRRGTARWLLAVSGLSVWVPMVLAVCWAAGQHTDVPALSIPDMVRTHGAVQALGFVVAGVIARTVRHDVPQAPVSHELVA